MSNIETISSGLKDTLLDKLSTESSSALLNKTLDDRIKELRNLNQTSILDSNKIAKLLNNEYNISLKDYTTLNSYNAKMTALYGNQSANSFQNNLNNMLGINKLKNETENSIASAKTFIEKMKEQGVSNSSALKLYSAIKSYSLYSSFQNYNFVNATV